MTPDEIIADPMTALGLDNGEIVVSVAILVEYLDPRADDNRRRLSMTSDDDMPPWTLIGMAQFASQIQYDDVRKLDDD